MTDAVEVPGEVLGRLRRVCLALPDVHEDQAWVGTRWCIRRKNFAHVLTVVDGWPPAYARAAATDGPAVVLTFRSAGEDLDALVAGGPPFFKPPWHPNVVGVVLDGAADWEVISELLVDSYCDLAPARLAAQVTRDPEP